MRVRKELGLEIERVREELGLESERVGEELEKGKGGES